MKANKFLVFCAVCAFLSTITTFGVHWLFANPPTFEEQVKLYQNDRYIFRNLWVIVHCLLVIVSVAGVLIRRYQPNQGWLILGFGSFLVFGMTEIFRMTFALTYLNRLRMKYDTATDEILQTILRSQIESWQFINAAMFLIFITAFALGNLFYAIGLWQSKGLEKWLAILLLAWAVISFTGLWNSLYPNELTTLIVQSTSTTYQPFMRMLLGVWLWKNRML